MSEALSGISPGLPWWHPHVFARRRPRLEQRARLTALVRGFFAQRDFVEVETPALQVCPGLEPHLRAFVTTLHPPQGVPQPRSLHTSPELTMKKLLVAGVPRLYQLAHVFRDGEASATHHPEFTMLEWYRAGASYRDLVADCVALVREAASAAQRPQFYFRGATCDPFAPWEVLTVPEAFQRYANIDIMATLDHPTDPGPAALAAETRRIGLHCAADDRWEDLFFRILMDRVETRLGHGVPTILMDYPLPQAALARPTAADPRLAERFELYACGLELANAFGELTDPTAQRARFLADQALQTHLYARHTPIDEDFLAALAHGMPESAGIALGFDRLVMLCTGAEDVADVLWAPVT